MNGIHWKLSLDFIKKYTLKIETPVYFGTGFFVSQSKISDIPIINIVAISEFLNKYYSYEAL